jgi:hypothetical protein
MYGLHAGTEESTRVEDVLRLLSCGLLFVADASDLVFWLFEEVLAPYRVAGKSN